MVVVDVEVNQFLKNIKKLGEHYVHQQEQVTHSLNGKMEVQQ